MIDFCWLKKINVLVKACDNYTHILLKYGSVSVTFKAKVLKLCIGLIFAQRFYDLIKNVYNHCDNYLKSVVHLRGFKACRPCTV
jgi:hypothetical protein